MAFFKHGGRGGGGGGRPCKTIICCVWYICMISYIRILGTQSVSEVSTTDEVTIALQNDNQSIVASDDGCTRDETHGNDFMQYVNSPHSLNDYEWLKALRDNFTSSDSYNFPVHIEYGKK